jgi:isopenicillin N synthase-like dioxygenase
MSFTSIPVLDLALAKDPATKPAFLSDLRHALMEVGFLYLKNVGIPDELFKHVVDEGRAFFDLPMEEKYAVSHSTRLSGGYSIAGRLTAVLKT